MYSVFVAARQVQPESIVWCWPGRIPGGGLSLVEGNPGGGKSTLLYDLAARVSVGREMPASDGAASPAGVVWLSEEDSAATSRRNLEANAADLDRVSIYDKRRAAGHRITLPADFDLIEVEIERIKAKLVVLDPISAFLEGSINVEKHVRDALGPAYSRTKGAKR